MRAAFGSDSGKMKGKAEKGKRMSEESMRDAVMPGHPAPPYPEGLFQMT